MKAIAILDTKYVKGEVSFMEDIPNKQTIIRVNISGLTPGKHGFHIHEYGDMRKGCESMGPHYNPFHKDHGGLNSKIRHVGDFGNIIVDKNGYVKNYIIKNKTIKLRGKYSIIGRGIVVHKDEDDLGLGNYSDSKTTGHSGARIACGIIALSG